MTQKQPVSDDLMPEAYLQGDDGNFFYGSSFADAYLLRNPASLPRYGHLARKALLHYGGDRFNLHYHGMMVEPFIREIIHEMVSYKVLFRTRHYDWEWIDHTLRKAIGGCLRIDLVYNQERIDAGFCEGAKAPVHINWSQRH